MSKYITDFRSTGNSTINVDAVCKDWNDRFAILNYNQEKYTLVVDSKRKNTRLKTQISKEQAFAVIERLKLIHVKNPVFRSAGSFHSESFIKSEVERLAKIKQDKKNELLVVSKVLYWYEKCL